MCKICKQMICPSECPNYIPKIIGRCFCCGADIEEGEEVYTTYKDDAAGYVCEGCIDFYLKEIISDFTREELMELLDISKVESVN